MWPLALAPGRGPAVGSSRPPQPLQFAVRPLERRGVPCPRRPDDRFRRPVDGLAVRRVLGRGSEDAALEHPLPNPARPGCRGGRSVQEPGEAEVEPVAEAGGPPSGLRGGEGGLTGLEPSPVANRRVLFGGVRLALGHTPLCLFATEDRRAYDIEAHKLYQTRNFWYFI